MELVEIFQVLGIERTKDEREIKNAYRKMLAETNPEDNPEGFKRLRTAYEEACNLARRQEEEQLEEKQDDTPSGLWVQKAAEIYGRIDTRCDVKLWKDLFHEDIFLSLEEEDNCRIKLLRFLMGHFKLPTDVWKLLDEKLHITGDVSKLREKFRQILSVILSANVSGEKNWIFPSLKGRLMLTTTSSCNTMTDVGMP